MKVSARIASIDSLKEELTTLMGFIPSKTINRFDHSEQLLKKRKPTVACRLTPSMNFWLTTHFSRLCTTTNRSPIKTNCREEYDPEEKENLYD